ncbi:MAG: complex I subunit 5 family protein [Limisphaerales bacterium]
MSPPDTTSGGWLLVLALVTPLAGSLLGFVFGGRHAGRIALALVPVGVGLAVAVLVAVVRGDAPLVYVVGGWTPPLGVSLRADGGAAAMLLMTAVIMAVVALFAGGDLATPAGAAEARRPVMFWVLYQGLWAGLVAVFVSNDLFSLFVALELLTFAAVPLVCLDGRAATLEAALRYLMFALLGSLLYLLGAGLIYGAFGGLDLTLLSGRAGGSPVVRTAAALMIAGLLAKTALFPLHLWLPPAHAGAPPAASAVLSALVVKAGFFLVLRLWFGLLAGAPLQAAAQLLAALGAGAVLYGSVLALRQARLKLLIAYSTLAQIGYLFLVFPLAGADEALHAQALTGGLLQVMSHALAKAAMFLGAGLLATGLGSDRLDGLRGAGRALPLTVLALAIAGFSLIGLPPSGGFRAKWLLLDAAIVTGQWWWGLVIIAGGVLSVGYVFRVLSATLDRAAERPPLRAPVARWREWLVLGLALGSMLLGFSALAPMELVTVGR